MGDDSPAPTPNLEARVAKLESDVAYIRGDIGEIKATLNRLAPLIDEFRGAFRTALPNLATKTELVELRSALKSEMAELRSELKSEMAELRSELKSEMAELHTELKSEMAELRLDIVQRPTRRQAVFDIFAIVGLIGAVIAIAEHLAH
jgi:chromosome segregation ATPase